MENQAYKRVVIPQSELPPHFGKYQRYILTHGHVAGVLNGFGRWNGHREHGNPKYRLSRWKVVLFARRYGVEAVPASTALKDYAVWRDAETGVPVIIEIQ